MLSRGSRLDDVIERIRRGNALAGGPEASVNSHDLDPLVRPADRGLTVRYPGGVMNTSKGFLILTIGLGAFVAGGCGPSVNGH